MRSVKKKGEVHLSFEEENTADHRRFAALSPEERLPETAVLQERQWGPEWTSQPIVKVARWEIMDW